MSANTNSEKSFMEQYGSLKEDDRIRGSTPADLANRCLAMCQAYIGGSWTLAKDASEVEVQRISGGLTNQLYSVQLLDSVPSTRNEVYPNEPRKVAVKLFQKKLIDPSFGRSGESERLSDVVVLTLLSQAEVCPKVYGIFDDGFVQTFYEHSQYRPVHQQNPKLQAKVAQLLATTHNMKVPIAKTNKWLLEMIENSLRDAYEVDGIAAFIETLGLEHLAKRDIRLEFADLLAWMADVKASYFCHNDFRRGNILVVQDPPGEETVKLVDFEYCSFGFRGFDLASFLLEWGREKFDKRPVQAPSDEVIESFVKLYIDACNEVVPGFSQDSDNALEKIVLEAKKCMLFNYFFLMSFILQQKEAFIKGMPFSKETNLKFVEELCKMYYTVKGQWVEQGVITKEPF